jgi:hypothetical protein
MIVAMVCGSIRVVLPAGDDVAFRLHLTNQKIRASKYPSP